MQINIKKKEGRPTFTYFIPICREWFLPKYLENLAELKFPERTEAVVYIDTRDAAFYNRVIDGFKAQGDKFCGLTFIFSDELPLPERGIVEDRRKRIIEIHKRSRQHFADSHITFGQEDDMILPADTFKRLLRHMIFDAKIGFIQGVALGRWKMPYIGAWLVKFGPLSIEEISTVPYQEGGLMEIQGGGWYCFAIYTSFVKNAFYKSDGDCLGPDMQFCLDIVKKGFKAYADFDIICEHHDEYKNVFIPDPDQVIQVHWKRIGNKMVRYKEEQNKYQTIS